MPMTSFASVRRANASERSPVPQAMSATVSPSLDAGGPHGVLPPGLVAPERVDAVVQVVGAGDRGEHRPDLVGLILVAVRVAQGGLLPDNAIGGG
jgi:hypothetical protein